MMKPWDHKAATAWARVRVNSPVYSECDRLAGCYLDLKWELEKLRELVQKNLDAWKDYDAAGVSESLWKAAKDSDAALRDCLKGDIP